MDNTTKQYRLQCWADAIRDCRESGLTVAEWCELHSVSKFQYYYRQRVVREAAAQQLSLMQPAETPAKFAEVKLLTFEQEKTVQSAMPDVSACIRINNTDVLVSENISQDLMIRIIKAVRSC